MTSTRSDGFNTLLYAFVPVQIMSVYGVVTERMEYSLLFLLNLFVIAAHLHYAICVVRTVGAVSMTITAPVLVVSGSTNLYAFEHQRVQDHRWQQTTAGCRRAHQALTDSRPRQNFCALRVQSRILPHLLARFSKIHKLSFTCNSPL